MNRRPRALIVRQGPYDLLQRREAEALVRAGWDVDLLLANERGRPLRECGARITIYRVPLHRRRRGAVRYVAEYVSFFLVAAACITALMSFRRYRVVQITTMPDFLVFAAFPARLMGARIIGFFKEPSPELAQILFGRAWLVRLMVTLEQHAIRYVDRAITVTQELCDTYVARGADPRGFDVVLNATAPQWEAGTTRRRENGFTVFTHGTVADRYGHDTVVTAIALAAPHVPDLHFRFAGSGPAVDDVLKLATELDVRERVHHLGFVSDEAVGREIANADVAVVPQKASEYAHLVHTCKLFEYLHAGKPVVVSRLRATEAYFGPHALRYFGPGDPQELSEAILELYRRPDRRSALAERAAELHEQHGWHKQERRYVAAVEGTTR